ncbi:glycosyltransferase family 4 protein [Primorskyibacter marinus]|uniref:glycosyltransferase family 4 protein n=1 Tax=Primorskyibacter marinus TaxID=1977320 RepID=UPI000E304F30|nr:glycosyltransferase family 4 protein [Primorskyibacter marinus]
MRTAIVTGEYYIGGETFINRHIQHLFGGDTVVVCGRFHGENPYDKAWFARREKPTTADLLTAPYWMLHNRIVHNTSRLPFGKAKRDLADFLRAQKVELILAEFGTQALAMAPIANELGLPVFTYFRGTDASKAIQTERMREAYRRMMPRLDGVFSVSQFLLDNLAKHNIRHLNSTVIPSGVDVRQFVPGQKQPFSCLAVGRFVEKKAPLTTLRSFAEATHDLPDAHLDFIGDGPLLDDAKKLANDLDATPRVSFHGSQPHAFVRGKLATAQFFLQHSITAANGNTEGLPTAIQEAMACGCVTVSTRHAGIPEAIDEGSTGWLVEEHDAAGFTAAIRRAMQAPDLPQMATRARQVAEQRFDNDVLLKKLETRIRATLA